MAKSFTQNLRYFRANIFLRTFALLLRMKRNEFCAVLRYFLRNLPQNRKYFMRKLRMKRNFSFGQIFLRNLRKTASFTQNLTF